MLRADQKLLASTGASTHVLVEVGVEHAPCLKLKADITVSSKPELFPAGIAVGHAGLAQDAVRVEDFGGVENGLDEPLLDARKRPMLRPDDGRQDVAGGSEAGAVFGHRGLTSVIFSSLLPFVSLDGPVEELDVLEPRIERELLEVLPEVGGHFEVEIDQRLGHGLPPLERARRKRDRRLLLRGQDGAGIDG